MYDLIIIGCGASGLFAASLVQDYLPGGLKILVLEKMPAIARKLLISGNGQCNFTNLSVKPTDNINDFLDNFSDHFGDKKRYAKKVLSCLTNVDLITYFEKLGLKSYVRDDFKVFPDSLKASDLVNVLYQNALKYPVVFKKNQRVIKVTKNEGCYLVTTKTDTYKTRYIFLATGGASYPETGSEADIQKLVKDLDIKVRPFKPALCSPLLYDYQYSGFAGIAFEKIKISLWRDNNKDCRNKIKTENIPVFYNSLYKDYIAVSYKEGALLFTHKNLSGPVILDNSFEFEKDDLILVHLNEYLNISDFNNYLLELFNNNPKKILKSIINSLNIPEKIKIFLSDDIPDYLLDTKVSQVSKAQRFSIALKFHCLIFKIKELGNIKTAMLSSGGVLLNEINFNEMNLKKYPEIYLGGECVDISGDTGGYNIHFAFACAGLAIKNLKEKIKR